MTFDLVLFGGTGDLAWRKLMPALFQAFRHGTLPPNGRIIGVARDGLSDQQYRELIEARFAEVEGAKRPNAEEFARFAKLLHFVQLDLSKTEDYQRLKTKLDERRADTVVMYLATAPALFATACEQLGAAGLVQAHTRIVLEKPLGHDLESNRAINATVRRVFREDQIFRIDHYLGKPSVQNLFALRFGNALFEPLWRRELIANIQITIAEDLGVEKRGGFYEKTGALRDMVQNHALQLVCAIGMEPPIDASADAIRDEKLKVLRSLRPWTTENMQRHAVRGQYAAGVSDGARVPGYRDESGVDAQSNTETFVALRTEITNWRWAGVPFYIRTGKRLAGREASIRINFRPTPHPIFRAPENATNQLVIQLQPRDGLELHLLAEGPDSRQNVARGIHPSTVENPQQPTTEQDGVAANEQHDNPPHLNSGTADSGISLETPVEPMLTPVLLGLDFDSRFGSERVGAYERLLLDVIHGRLNLFVRSDEQEAAWRWVEPLLNAWNTGMPRSYAAGTWGPSAASAMIARDGYCWAEEC